LRGEQKKKKHIGEFTVLTNYSSSRIFLLK
jgi:hypothetical protein